MDNQRNKIYHQKPVQKSEPKGKLIVSSAKPKAMKAVSKSCGCGKAKYKSEK